MFLKDILMLSYFSVIEDPNSLGELLRNWAFKEEYGCYSCFDLIDGFSGVEVTPREFKMMWHRDYNPESTGEYWGDPDSWYIKRISWHKHWCGIEVGWFWDGDGTLLFYVPEINAVVMNTDCKKSYGWEFMESQNEVH